MTYAFPQKSESDKMFGVRIAREPEICIGASEGLIGAYMKIQRLILPPQSVHVFKFSGVLYGRQPCFQEVSTKRYEKVSLVHLIRWKSVEPEDLGICLLQGLISERFKDYWPFGVPVFQGLACEVQEAFPHNLSKHPDSTLAVSHRCFSLGLQHGFCFSIGYGAPFT